MHDNLAIRVLHTTLEASVAEATKSAGTSVLGYVLSAALVGPSASILAAVAKSLVSELLKATSGIDRKIDAILGEPFQTAVNTIQEVLSVQAKTPDDLAEFYRRLNNASDKLDEAYSFADQMKKPDKLLIRLYQALVNALKQGGRPFLELYVSEIRLVALEEQGRAANYEARAEQATMSYGDALTANQTKVPREKTVYLDLAARSLKFATEVEMYCDFVTKLSEFNLEALQTPMQNPLAQLAQRLTPNRT